MPEWAVPGLILMVGAPLLALLRPRMAFAAGALLLPVLSASHLLSIPMDTSVSWSMHGLTLTPTHLDGVSWLWAAVFHVAAFLGALYSLGDEEDRLTPVMGLMYAGAAIQAVTAGDLVSLFVGWELTGVFSVFLVWGRGGDRAFHTGLRYLAWQVLSGVLLLAGVLWRAHDGLSLDLGPVPLDSAGAWFLLAAVGIKVCFPLLHTWLTDAYPEATPGGTVFLSAFTTKMAIYALLRMFAGWEPLITVGAVMTVLPLLLALRTDDTRRILAYVLVNQLGFMVTAIGIGTDLALAGVSALAVVHILYKSLLFMATGAVLHTTGTARASRLGGLASVMPVTLGLYLLGAWSHLPGLAGYASKSLITAAAGDNHQTLAFLLLEATTAGMVLVAGVHLPWSVWGRRVDTLAEGARPAPLAMKAAMASAGLLLVVFGLQPSLLWDALPFAFDRAKHSPYNVHHALAILQLSAGAAFAYFGLLRFGAFHPARAAAPLDADQLDRTLLPAVAIRIGRAADMAWQAIRRVAFDTWNGALAWGFRRTGPGSAAASTFTTRSGALSMAVLLTLYAVLFFTRGTPTPLPAPGHHAPSAGDAAQDHGGGGHGSDADHGSDDEHGDAHGSEDEHARGGGH